MSRRTLPAALALLLAAGLAPAAAHAQAAAPGDAYGPVDTRAKPKCDRTGKPGEIVVCAEDQDQSQYRVKSSSELDPNGKGAKDGVPRAPDVGTVYPGMVVAKGCFIPPCPPPMPVLIDLKAIPEAPPGSDADRAGRGLAPARSEAVATPPGSASPAAPPSG